MFFNFYILKFDMDMNRTLRIYRRKHVRGHYIFLTYLSYLV